MRKGFLPRLAATGLSSNRQTYLPYFLTCTGTVLMFYNMCALTYHTSVMKNVSISSLMSIGMWVTAIFAVIFLFYTNSFVIKRRKKEFGIYNILGLEKKHIGITMLFESLYVYLGSMVFGIGLGILFNKLITLLLYRMLRFDPNFRFEISSRAILYCAVLFAGIALLNLLYNLLQVRLSNPIQLLHGSSAGEKEPKAKWITALLGVITLGTGYWLAITIQDPVETLLMFFVAVILVIIGTYLLFTAGSVAILKLLRKNKGYYYKPAHFTTVSGMIYRMKQNAAGLASICILSTAVLVMISTTVSLFVGSEDLLHTRYPEEIEITAAYPYGTAFDTDALLADTKAVAQQAGRQMENLKAYTSVVASTDRQGNTFAKAAGGSSNADVYLLVILSAQDYYNLTGKEVSVGPGEMYACGSVFGSEEAGDWDSIEVLGSSYRLAGREGDAPKIGAYSAWMVELCCLVTDNTDTVASIAETVQATYGETSNPYSYYSRICFDMDGTAEEKAALAQDLREDQISKYSRDTDSDPLVTMRSRETSRNDFLSLYGGLFFLGIFLGSLFLMATVLIIYYKQIVEGYDDKDRFAIMQKVGMSRQEVKRTVRTQVLLVFFIPLLAAAVHITAAFPMLTRLLNILALDNIPLFLVCTVCTVLVFALIYALVYSMTAKVYYRIVYRKG